MALNDIGLFLVEPFEESVGTLQQKYLPQLSFPPISTDTNLNSLASTKQYHAILDQTKSAILSTPADDIATLLHYWSTRFDALIKLHQFRHLAQELANIFPRIPPSAHQLPLNTPSTLPLFDPVVPFDIHQLLATLPAYQGDFERGVELTTRLIKSCKRQLISLDDSTRTITSNGSDLEEERAVWVGRIELVGLHLAHCLVQTNAIPSAIALLRQRPSSPRFTIALARIHLSTGDLASSDATVKTFAEQSELDTTSQGGGNGDRDLRKLRGLGLVAHGEWTEAEVAWRALYEEDTSDIEALNNLAVTHLFISSLSTSISLLEALLQANPVEGFSSESVLFNLSTLWELRTEGAMGLKIDLLRRAVEGGHEGLKAGWFKLGI